MNDSLIRVGVLVVLGSIAGCTKGSVPRLDVVKSNGPPTVDGWLEDSVWGFAKTTGPFVDTRTGGPSPFRASAKLLWDESYLYVGVEVHDALLRASHTKHDDPLWEQDCVELMIDSDGDARGYYEIHVSPRGVVFDSRFDARREPRPFGHVDWDSGVRVEVALRGRLDDSDSDGGYTVEMAIPWHAFSMGGEPASAPAIGDVWRGNLYVMDLGGARQQAAAWSPPRISDFHVPHRFGILAFEGH